MDKASAGAEQLGPSDGELLEALRAGDESAYEELYRRHIKAARQLARRYARQATDADDIVSASFADILQAIRRGAGPTDSFRYYLLACVRRNGGRYVGQRWTMPLDEASGTADPVLAVGEGDDLDRLLAWRAFSDLPARYRTALWHALVEGDTLAEVGTFLGLNANAAGALVHRAKEQLRQAFLAQMMAAPRPEGSCSVTSQQLAALARGAVRGRKADSLHEHVLDCAYCRTRLVEIAPVEQAMKVLIGPAILGISVYSYVGRRGVAAGWLAGAGGGLVAAVLVLLAVLNIVPPANSSETDGAAPPDGSPTMAIAATSAVQGGSGAQGTASGAEAAPAGELDAATPAALATQVGGASISQPSTPRLYPGDDGVLRLAVDAGDGGEVRVVLPAGLTVRAAALSDTCRSADGLVTCGPLQGKASVSIPFSLSPDLPMGSVVHGGQATLARDGQQVAGPVSLDVAVHADPCCSPK